jgi:DNA topoisomerase I
MGRRLSDQGGGGRFGPYVQYGAKKYASLKKEDDPYTVTLERALEIIREKQTIEANRIIKEFRRRGHPGAERPLRPVHQRRQEERQDPERPRAEASLTLEECQALIAAAPERGGTLGSQDAQPRRTG